MPPGTWPKKGDAADISPPKGKRGKQSRNGNRKCCYPAPPPLLPEMGANATTTSDAECVCV